jgi:hypothetical protein
MVDGGVQVVGGAAVVVVVGGGTAVQLDCSSNWAGVM